MEREIIIEKWYKKIALFNLFLSIVGFFIFSKTSMSERLTLLIFSNAGFHIMYGFIAFLPRYQLKFVRKQNGIYEIAKSAMKLFSNILIIIGLLFSLFLLISSISSNNFHESFLFCTPLGIALGGVSLNNYLKKL